jgi:hypothetical protein
MADIEILDDNPRQEQQESRSKYVWQYFTITNSSEVQKGGAKNAVCMFCDKKFSGCSTTRAAAHILGCPVLGQLESKAGIQACITTNKKK